MLKCIKSADVQAVQFFFSTIFTMRRTWDSDLWGVVKKHNYKTLHFYLDVCCFFEKVEDAGHCKPGLQVIKENVVGENVVSSVSFSERFIENWDFGTHTLSRNYHCSKLCSTHSSSSQLSIDNHQLETFQKASHMIYYSKKYGNTWPRIGLLWQTRKYVLVSFCLLASQIIECK